MIDWEKIWKSDMIDWEKVWKEFDEWYVSFKQTGESLWAPDWEVQQAKIQELVDEQVNALLE